MRYAIPCCALVTCWIGLCGVSSGQSTGLLAPEDGQGRAAHPVSVRLDVLPQQTVSPIQEWHLRAWVEKDDFNRMLRVEAHAADYDRATEIPLEGSFASRIHDVWWRGLVPCGTYLVAASVLGPSGQLLNQARKEARICVRVEAP